MFSRVHKFWQEHDWKDKNQMCYRLWFAIHKTSEWGGYDVFFRWINLSWQYSTILSIHNLNPPGSLFALLACLFFNTIGVLFQWAGPADDVPGW